jgi:Glycosyltransferase family 87
MRFQEKVAPGTTDAILLVTHPAFEELLFVPLSLLSYRAAFWLFLTLNIALLALCLRLLKPKVTKLAERWHWFPFFLFVAFFPISRTLLQGQDSVLLLTLLAGAFVLLDRNQALAAGLLIGIGVFRYQIAIPIGLLFLIWRRWRFAAGFALSSAGAALLSLSIVGWHGAQMYVNYMLSISVRMSTEADMRHFGNTPLAMLNLRGLLSALLWGKMPHAAIETLILLSSVAVILISARRKPSLPLAIVAASLVSYHFIAHDASIWIIPIMLALCGESALEAALAAAMLIVPLTAVITSAAYLAALPLLAFFGAITVRGWRFQVAEKTAAEVALACQVQRQSI